MNADNTASFMHEAWQTSMTYHAYRNLIGTLLLQHKTTGNNQSPEYVHYTRLNAHRMNRIDRTLVLHDATIRKLQKSTTPTCWLVITEAWCGDAANIIPVLEKMAQANPAITMRLVLRDNHPELMQAFLTDGGESVPKLIAFRQADGEQLYTWGPRPAAAQALMHTMKNATPTPDYAEIAENIQRWYNLDKTKQIQQEVAELVAQLEPQLS